jgi:hypothetical protein
MSPTAAALLDTWTGPLESPPLADLPIEAFEPAFEAAFGQHLREIVAIANHPEPPAFDNTIAALERSGRELGRTLSLFQALTGTMSDKRLQAAEQRLSPLLAQHQDAVALAPGLYERVARVHAQVHTDGADIRLTDEQRRVAERYAVSLERRGARLPEADKVRLTAINTRLARTSWPTRSRRRSCWTIRPTSRACPSRCASRPPRPLKSVACRAAGSSPIRVPPSSPSSPAPNGAICASVPGAAGSAAATTTTATTTRR